jgi:hypothetical protein
MPAGRLAAARHLITLADELRGIVPVALGAAKHLLTDC